MLPGKDIRNASLEERPRPQAYLPFWQSTSPHASVVLRTTMIPETIASAVRRELSALDPALAFADVCTMDQLVSEATEKCRFETLLLSSFSLVALVLSLVGLYALLAYSVRQRTAEFGIRVALGAQKRDVMRLIMEQGAALAFTGIGLGLPSAWALTRLLASLLFEVKATDAVTFATVGFVFCVVLLVACYIPGRQAVQVDPMAALRHE